MVTLINLALIVMVLENYAQNTDIIGVNLVHNLDLKKKDL